jgi:hypothetical protein
MLLIIFLGLIAKLASVCDRYDVGTSEVNNFDWNELGFVVLTQFLTQATAAWFKINLRFHLRKLNTAYQTVHWSN